MKIKKIPYHEPFHSLLQRYWHFIPKPIRVYANPVIMKISQRKYSNIFSLGPNCLSALTLKAVSLRRYSGPFDWIYGSTIDERLKLILNDFNGFLKKEDFIIRENILDKKMKTYDAINQKTKFGFPHDFYSRDIDECFSEINEKYRRRISRLNEKLRNSSSLILYVVENKEEIDLIKLGDLLKKIKEKSNCKKLDLCYMFLGKTEEEKGEVVLFEKDIAIYFIELKKSSTGTQGWWTDNRYTHSEISRWINTICTL